MKKTFMFVAAMMFAACSLSAKEIKVLTIGNSFADSVFVYLPDVAKSVPDCNLVIERANHGGCELDRHWRYISEEESDAAAKNYRNKTATMRDILKSGNWDVVTIQQASPKSWKTETYFPYAQNIYDYIKKFSPNSEVVIQQTWAYRADDARISPNGAWGIDQTEMFNRIKAAYATAAKKLNLRVIPSGQAVQNFRAVDPQPLKKADKAVFDAVKYPAPLPFEGDIVGANKWSKSKDGTYRSKLDSIHLNQRGQYLQACVWFGFLFDKDPTEIKFAPKGISPEDAKLMREVAKKTLAEFKQPRDQK